ncbi:MAG: SMC-Scp complex subunit ScpB [Oscillospiraceae bacterium]
MNTKLYKGAVEAVLFAVGEPISAEKISLALDIDKNDVVSLINEIKNDCDDLERGVCVLQFDDRYQMATRPMFADFVTRALDNRRNTPLSQAAMEVLAIIAYNQPVSRSFIDQIRGVDSNSAVSSLVAKNLVCEAGRLELPGRPIAFKTTDNFLRCFGIAGTAELPPIHGDEIEYSLSANIPDEPEMEEMTLE